MIKITRYGTRVGERSISIKYGFNSAIKIDPQEAVYQLTGELISRNSCVQDFAQGILSSGHRVFVNDKRFPQYRNSGEREVLRQYRPMGIAYFMLGFAWGRVEWNEFCLRLTSFSRLDSLIRLGILEETGRYYMRNSYDRGPIMLRVPLKA